MAMTTKLSINKVRQRGGVAGQGASTTGRPANRLSDRHIGHGMKAASAIAAAVFAFVSVAVFVSVSASAA